MAQLESIESTRPYLSLTVARIVGEVDPVPIPKDLLAELRDKLEIEPDGPRRRLLAQLATADDAELPCSYLHYLERRPPSWLLPDAQGEILESLHHLLVVCRHLDHICVYASDPAVQRLLGRRLKADGGDGAFADLRKIPRQTLANAFLGGAVRTLWLSGIHRRTAVKADSKILSGIRLQDALKPLDDQSYHFTAARAVAPVALKPQPVGISQRRSKVWIGATNGWQDFAAKAISVVDRLREFANLEAEEERNLPFLAYPATDLGLLEGPFDVALVPPELLAIEAHPDPDLIQLAEKWAYRASFRLQPPADGKIVTDALLDEVKLAEVRFELQLDSPERVGCSFETEPEPDADDEVIEELERVLANSAWLQIRFESGHTLSGGAIYELRYRDQLFENWRFEDLGETSDPRETDPKKEKPTPDDNPHKFLVNEIGEHKSLFCWVQRHWYGLQGFGSQKGWLACDDGAMEIADFVHLDTEPDDGGRPRISLIHVKGSKNGDIGRGISVSDYEVVCGQAVKNLRSLDQLGLAAQLRAGAGKDVAGATWKDNQLAPEPPADSADADLGRRAGLVAALEALGSNYRRRVIVFQPRVTRAKFLIGEQAMGKGDKTAPANRLRQLNTLLLATEADCQDLGADFWVLSADVPD